MDVKLQVIEVATIVEKMLRKQELHSALVLTLSIWHIQSCVCGDVQQNKATHRLFIMDRFELIQDYPPLSSEVEKLKFVKTNMSTRKKNKIQKNV